MPNTTRSRKSAATKEVLDTNLMESNPNFRQCEKLLNEIQNISGRSDFMAYISSRDYKSYALTLTIVYKTPVE